MKKRTKTILLNSAVLIAATITLMLAALVIGAEDSYAASFEPTVTVKANAATVTWKKQKGYSKYEVWMKPFYSTSGFKKIKTTKKLKYTYKGKYCTSYRVYVRAIKGNKSRKSSEVRYETGSNPKLSIKRIASLPSKKINSTYYASRIDAMCFAGKDLYYLKSAHNTINNKKEVHEGYYPMAIGRIKNFAAQSDTQNPKVTFKVIKYKNGALYYGSHGSSITYYDGDFYIVTVESHKKNGKPIIRVGKDGIIKEEISTKGFYYNDIKFSALAFYGTTTVDPTAPEEDFSEDESEEDPSADVNTDENIEENTNDVTNEGADDSNTEGTTDSTTESTSESDTETEYPQFICRDGKNTTRVSSEYGYELHRFSVGTLKDGVLYRERSFMTENTAEAAFWQSDKSGKQELHSNDIGYDVKTGTLWHPIFIYEKDGTSIKNNWLYSYDVANSVETWVYDDDHKTNSLIQIKKQKIALNKTKSSETKLEIEGTDVYNGKTYIVVNTDGVEDALYLVK